MLRMPTNAPTSDSRTRGATCEGAALVLTLVLVLACAPPAEVVPAPPETRVDPVVETLHGVEIEDPYRWLEDQESSETRQWIEAQNDYTDSLMASLPDQEGLRQRFSQLLKIDTVGSPVARGGRYFFSKRRADQDLSVVYLRQGLEGEDEVLLDPHPLSEDHTTSISLQDVSKDGTLLVYSVRQGGEDEVTIKLFSVEERADLPDVLSRDRYFGASLTPDKTTLFYTRQTEAGPRIYRHTLGREAQEDQEIFGQGYGPEKIVYASLSPDGRYLVAHVLHGSAADKTEIYLKDLRGDAPFVTVVDDVVARFQAVVVEDHLYLETNWEAPNGRVLVTSVGQPGRDSWQEFIAERPDSVIESVSQAGGRFFVNYLTDVKSRVVSFGTDGREIGEIAFDNLGTVGNVGGEWDSQEAFFAFSSFHVPTTIYRYDIESGARTVWSKPDVPIDSDRFEVKQVWYDSRDGTRVPMFLVHAAGLERNGSSPTLLTGYGGFTASLTPSFSSTAAVWVERGGVYAVANLRGGGEFGEPWHQAGMRENKQNVFDDFIAAAEWLVKNNYTRPDKLAIRGGSNGGLLVGATMNQRPDLFGAVICSYPLLDMVRYHNFLVARYWVPEYGSAEDPEQFQYIRAYSPYHNVEPGTSYPSVLFITGDRDTRVAPLHARKMAALMQAQDHERPVLLRYHTKAGHSGGQPISEQIGNLVESFSFLFWQLGVVSES